VTNTINHLGGTDSETTRPDPVLPDQVDTCALTGHRGTKHEIKREFELEESNVGGPSATAGSRKFGRG
jgi:hypothetical protein